jgi:hypothetical protein
MKGKEKRRERNILPHEEARIIMVFSLKRV